MVMMAEESLFVVISMTDGGNITIIRTMKVDILIHHADEEYGESYSHIFDECRESIVKSMTKTDSTSSREGRRSINSPSHPPRQ